MTIETKPGDTKYHNLWLGICGNENKNIDDYYTYCITVFSDPFFLEYLVKDGYEQDTENIDEFSYGDANERLELYEIHSKYLEGIANSVILNNDLSVIFDEAFAKPTEEQQTPNVGVKNDIKDDKLRMDLIPLDVLEDIAKVYTEGAKKYGDNTWQPLENGYERYKGALLRHLCESERTVFDEETGCRHLAQVAWNAIAMLWLSKHGTDE